MIKIIPSDSKLWEQTWRIYTESFPEHERRRISSHGRAVEDPRFHTLVTVENGNLMGLLFYWNFSDRGIYIEHLAVNPSFRSQNIGSSILCGFIAQNPDATIILEIAAPVDRVSRRRLKFYQRLGFVANDFEYVHPSYQKKGVAHEFILLSFPRPISEAEYEEFYEFLKENVLKYID